VDYPSISGWTGLQARRALSLLTQAAIGPSTGVGLRRSDKVTGRALGSSADAFARRAQRQAMVWSQKHLGFAGAREAARSICACSGLMQYSNLVHAACDDYGMRGVLGVLNKCDASNDDWSS